jgi:hypothetical protein
MAEFLKLFADPDRMYARLHRYTRMRHVRKPLFDRLRCRSEAATVYDFIVVVESAVMAPDISKVYADRNDKPRLSARNFDDEVLRGLLHGKQSLFERTCSSHFSSFKTLQRTSPLFGVAAIERPLQAHPPA